MLKRQALSLLFLVQPTGKAEPLDGRAAAF